MAIRPVTRPSMSEVLHDVYRDVHKGIRSELFSLVESAGRLDPSDRLDRAALADHTRTVMEILVAHAEHEDFLEPALRDHLPTFAEQVNADHEELDATLRDLVGRADAPVDASVTASRRDVHALYVDLAAFTAEYLRHQDLEERIVMPALEQAIGVDGVIGIHVAIQSSVPPEQMTRFLALMLPAMNVEDRAEMLGGMQASVPAEVFAASWSLARSVLPAADHAALAERLDLG